jgi:hypothetical protein
MPALNFLVFQFVLSLAAYAAIGGWFAWPWLRRKPIKSALQILLLPHLFRHVGVNLLVPELVDPTMPHAFARQTAAGDTITVALAWFALVSLRMEWWFGIAAVWLFNIIGLTDMLQNLVAAARTGAAEHLGAAWYTPTFIVPGMLVVHALVFAVLLRKEKDARVL